MERNPKAAKPILEALKGRYSCRNFTGAPVDDAVLGDLIDTGLMAATGGNLQPYSILIVRNPTTKAELRRLGGGQAFIEQADVLLVFALDWSRYQVYTQQKHAPFQANHQFLHLLIGIEDILCAAQTIETGAYLSGLGACYVGGVLETGSQIARLLHFPQGAYPIVMLALGHPAPGSDHKPTKLPRDLMVFQERYRPISEAEIRRAYDAKYASVDRHPLPLDGAARDRVLEQLLHNLSLTYPESQAQSYLEEIRQSGAYNEAQRRYGVHYGVETMRRRGHETLTGMREMGCDPLKMERDF
ncbi:FMN reductase [NAD(P)H] [Oscillibacter sp. PC13]|uniref:nitroreductase family protein n=1 Tax=Oscillibacter sp. PC13 TaxID=1855299 RepID=UPI0008EF8C2D|nr:nitroreductase family protein [Oscillibacter sp. PC13]SFP25373.1 FMN reductase [NAD(P)H] [Oscillibacter sp. PC13]